jgi:hypothetical protein
VMKVEKFSIEFVLTIFLSQWRKMEVVLKPNNEAKILFGCHGVNHNSDCTDSY